MSIKVLMIQLQLSKFLIIKISTEKVRYLESNVMNREPSSIIQLSVDTVHGDRYLELIYGNLLYYHTDLWVTTVYLGKGGGLFQSIYELLGLGTDFSERRLIPIENGSYIGFIDHPVQKVLTLHLNKVEGDKISSDEFKKIISATFAAIAALIYEGFHFEEISIPVIGKKGLNQDVYEGSLNWFIHDAVNFIKFSELTKTIKFFVLDETDVSLWKNTFKHLFERNHEGKIDMYLFQKNIESQIITMIDSFSGTIPNKVRKVLQDIKNMIKSNDYYGLTNKVNELINLLLIEVYIKSMNETYTSEKWLTFDVKSDLKDKIQMSNWFFSYLSMIHYLKVDRYFASRDNCDENSTTILVLILKRVLTFYLKFVNELKSNKLKEEIRWKMNKP